MTWILTIAALTALLALLVWLHRRPAAWLLRLAELYEIDSRPLETDAELRERVKRRICGPPPFGTEDAVRWAFADASGVKPISVRVERVTVGEVVITVPRTVSVQAQDAGLRAARTVLPSWCVVRMREREPIWAYRMLLALLEGRRK